MLNVLVRKKAILLAALMSLFTSGCVFVEYGKILRSQATTKIKWSNENQITHIPFKLVDGVISLPVLINESKPLYLGLSFATPTPGVFENKNTKSLDDVGVNFKGEIAIVWVSSEGSTRVNAKLAHNLNFDIGDINVSDKSLFYIPFAELPYESRDEVLYDGFIGFDWFTNFVVKIDYDESIITLYDQSLFNESDYVDNWTSIPIEIDGGFPYVSAEVKMSEDAEPITLTMLLDIAESGASIALSPKAHDKINFPSSYYSFEKDTLSWGSEIKYGKGAQFRLGNSDFSDLDILFSDDLVSNEYDYHGVIGNRLLSQFNVVIDYQKNRMLIKKNERFGLPLHPDRSGLDVSLNQKGYLVKAVAKRANMENLGIKLGDIITSFNQVNASFDNIEMFRGVMSSNAESVHLCWISSFEEKCGELTLKDRLE